MSVRASGKEVVFLVQGVWDLFQIYDLDFNSSFCVVLYRSLPDKVPELLAIFPSLWAALGFPPPPRRQCMGSETSCNFLQGLFLRSDLLPWS